MLFHPQHHPAHKQGEQNLHWQQHQIFADAQRKGGQLKILAIIEIQPEAVQKDVALRARKDFTRSIFRSTTKKAAAVTSAAVAIRATPEKFRSITEIAVTKALDAVDLAETADIRQCRYFPSFAAGGGFTLKPGIYLAKVEYFDTNENLVGTETFENLEVKAGRPTIVESICVK